jgi:hypothetical protein
VVASDNKTVLEPTADASSLHVIASEAKQSRSNKKGLDCFVASAPRNDVARNGAEHMIQAAKRNLVQRKKAAHPRGFCILNARRGGDQRVTTTVVPTETR